MQFDGFIQACPIVIFIDLGSTTSFVSQALVSQFPQWTLQAVNHLIKVTDGGIMQCSAMVPVFLGDGFLSISLPTEGS